MLNTCKKNFIANFFEKLRDKKQYRKWEAAKSPFPPPDCIRHLIKERRIREYNAWIEAGKPVPPPNLMKQMIVKEYAKKYQTNIFIETGTLMGEMVDACASIFDQIYSIELSRDLFSGAHNRFSNQKHISIMYGDSIDVLPEILAKIEQPCLFWLDAHYSGGVTAKGKKETPILQEIQYILNHDIDRHIILIDDARCFNGQNDYPTIQELKNIILSHLPDWLFEIDNDVIRAAKCNVSQSK